MVSGGGSGARSERATDALVPSTVSTSMWKSSAMTESLSAFALALAAALFAGLFAVLPATLSVAAESDADFVFAFLALSAAARAAESAPPPRSHLGNHAKRGVFGIAPLPGAVSAAASALGLSDSPCTSKTRLLLASTPSVVATESDQRSPYTAGASPARGFVHPTRT